MEKNYNPKQIEESLYDFWEKNEFFKPKKLKKPTFCIMMPPPNITGNLHMGHAFQQTIMDILIRYNRMQGKNTLCQVGTDHAGIATQILVERKIFLKEKKTKKDFSRKELIQKAFTWKEKYKDIVVKQMKRLGISADWNREKFTLDPDICIAVREAFILFYKNNFIYQKKRLVHWDLKLETVVSDLEVKHNLEEGTKWFIKYPIFKNNISQKINVKYLVISTTRPETLLGDTAIAVNPKDNKHNQYIGCFVKCPLVDRIIPIIGDEYAEIGKGTSCVKITPAHDFNDYKVGLRHKLPMINIFTFDGKIRCFSKVYNYDGSKSNIYSNFIPDAFRQLDIFSARLKIVEQIKKIGLLSHTEKCVISVPYSDRSGAIIQPMLTNQWYLKTSKLAKIAVNAVKERKIKFIPKQYESMYLSWMNKIEDWCISRQLWWGHRIPIWYDDQNNRYVGQNEEEIRKTYFLSKNILLQQDKDVLDTWFSSALWTFSTLGWPKKTKFLKLFHSTDILVSGFDIIFFWIARMIMLTMYLVKDEKNNSEVPFKNVYITGLIRDEKGAKMSKSKGNVIDPLDMIDGISLKNLIKKRTNNPLKSNVFKNIVQSTIKQFPNGIESNGTDALRFTLSSLASNTRNINWDMNRLKGYRNFCNKLWNASRFVLINTKNHSYSSIEFEKNDLLINQWIILKANDVVKLYRNSLDVCRFDIAANILYDFIWNVFCDWYLEFVKIILEKFSKKEIDFTKNLLIYILDLIIRLAHPIIPFITESIWQRLKLVQNIQEKTIMLQPFPEYNEKIHNKEILIHMDLVKKIIVFLRKIRIKMNISPKKFLSLFFHNINEEQKNFINKNILFLKKMAHLKTIQILSEKYDQDLCIKEIIDGIEVIVPMLNIINVKTELKRSKKELKKIELKIAIIRKKLLNQQFLSFAPKKIVSQEKNRLSNLNENYQKLFEQIKKFTKLL